MHKLIPLVLTVAIAVGCERKSGSTTATNPATQPGDGAATCQRPGPPVTGPLKIAVIPKGATHEFWKSIHAGALKAEAEFDDVQVEWKGPLKEDDRTEQINVVENYIHPGTSGIVIAPLDNVALVRPIREATQAGIGVVIVDSGVNAEVCTDYASFIATDNYAGGVKGAQRLGELLGGKGKVLMMRYQEGSASTMQREQGFLDTLRSEFPEIQLVSFDQYGGATVESAMSKAENLLNRYTRLDGVFCPNETTTFGMLQAIEGAPLEQEIKFVGFDSSPKLIEALAEERIHGLVLQDPLSMGYLGVKTVVAYLRGEPVLSKIDTGSVVATPENMNEPRVRELLSPPIDQYLP